MPKREGCSARIKPGSHFDIIDKGTERNVSRTMSVVCIGGYLALTCISSGAMDWDGAEIVSGGTHVVVGGSHWVRRSNVPEDSRTLYLVSTTGDGRRVIHRSTGNVNTFKAAPQGNLLAISEYVGGPRMVILGTDGSVRDSIPGVHKYAWNPEGARIAYVTGTDSEEGLRSTGTWIYDVATRQSQKILDVGDDVAWAEWDGNIYILAPTGAARNNGVLRFDPKSGQASETSHKGIHFSPDGQYYYRGSGEGDPGGEVFRTAGDGPVGIDFSIEELGRKSSAIAHEWLGPGQLIAYSPIPGARVDYVVDVPSGNKRRVEGLLMHVRGRSDRTWVLKETSVTEQRPEDLLDR